MIRVEIHAIPHGDESKKTKEMQLVICNDLSHPHRPEWGNYVACLQDANGEKILGEFEVKNHLRSDGLFELVRRCVQTVGVQRLDA